MNCGFTYEIRDKTNPELVYYGSSELPTLEDRIKTHIYDFNYWKNTGFGYCSSYKLLEMGNWEAKMLKIVFFTIKWELHEQERKLIEYQTCVNEVIPNRTDAEYYQANKEKKTEWYEENKDKILQQKADYYQKNKDKLLNYNTDYREANQDKIKKQKAEWYQANKDKILEQNAEYRVKNKEKIKEQKNKKFLCDCGGKYTYINKSQHIKTNKHQNWVKSLSN